MIVARRQSPFGGGGQGGIDVNPKLRACSVRLACQIRIVLYVLACMQPMYDQKSKQLESMSICMARWAPRGGGGFVSAPLGLE